MFDYQCFSIKSVQYERAKIISVSQYLVLRTLYVKKIKPKRARARGQTQKSFLTICYAGAKVRQYARAREGKNLDYLIKTILN